MGAPDLVRARSAAVSTGVSAVDSLFSGRGSGVSLATVAVLVRVPLVPWATVPRSRIWRWSPAGRVPRAREPVQGCQVPPLSREYAPSERGGGRGSVRDTFWASAGPRLVRSRVYVSRPPADTGLGLPSLVMARSAASWTGSSSVSVLLSGLGSGVSLCTVAVLIKRASAEARTVPRSKIVWACPGRRVPKASVPAQGWKERPPSRETSGEAKASGRGSESTVFSAFTGPALATARV